MARVGAIEIRRRRTMTTRSVLTSPISAASLFGNDPHSLAVATEAIDGMAEDFGTESVQRMRDDLLRIRSIVPTAS